MDVIMIQQINKEIHLMMKNTNNKYRNQRNKQNN